MATCDLCGKEIKGLRKCRECNTVFCHWCMLEKDFEDTGGEIVEIDGFCPKCKGDHLIEVIP
jgi:hypothetical protein